MEANFNLRQHEHSRNPDIAEPTAPIGHPQHLREGALDGIIRFVIVFGYLLGSLYISVCPQKHRAFRV